MKTAFAAQSFHLGFGCVSERKVQPPNESISASAGFFWDVSAATFGAPIILELILEVAWSTRDAMPFYGPFVFTYEAIVVVVAMLNLVRWARSGLSF